MTCILSAEQLAETLGLDVETIRKMTRDGLLPFHRIGARTIRYNLPDVLARTAVNQHPDDEAVDKFAAAMHAKMTAARLKGKEGWDDPARCPDGRLIGLLDEAMDGLEWVDVANYAMMLWARGQSK
jgi:excisionase family DNA binding protein